MTTSRWPTRRCSASGPGCGGGSRRTASGREVERRLAVATTEWRGEQRDPALLWRGARLEAGLEVADDRPDEVTADERAFLDAAQDAAEGARRATERQNRRLRVLLGAAIALVLVAVAAGGLALRSRDREAAAATAAQRAAVDADARRLAASALTVEQPDLALLTAVEATRLEQSPDTFGAVLTLLARQPDVRHTRPRHRHLHQPRGHPGRRHGLPRRVPAGAPRRGRRDGGAALVPRRPGRGGELAGRLAGRPHPCGDAVRDVPELDARGVPRPGHRTQSWRP